MIPTSDAFPRVGVALLALLALSACTVPGNLELNSKAPAFDGQLAYHYALKAAAFGPRSPTSAAHAKLLAWLEHELNGTAWRAQRFTAQTPDGPLSMTNLIARFPGKTPGTIVLAGHYDTLSHRPEFVGANDGGSSTGILLALAQHFRLHPPSGPSIRIVWLDGEEAIHAWVGHDHTYGSRHLAHTWTNNGSIEKIRALIVLDMIGDRDLGIARQLNGTPWLMDLVCSEAKRIGAGDAFCNYALDVSDDDHPFRTAGAPAIDLIDFHYGPDNAYWHTPQDTPDKLSPQSFQIVGAVVLATIKALSSPDSQ